MEPYKNITNDDLYQIRPAVADKSKKGKKKQQIEFEQTEKAVEWCQTYHLSINLESYFYQKYNYKLKNSMNSMNRNDTNPKYKEYLDELDKYFENYIGYSSIF